VKKEGKTDGSDNAREEITMAMGESRWSRKKKLNGEKGEEGEKKYGPSRLQENVAAQVRRMAQSMPRCNVSVDEDVVVGGGSGRGMGRGREKRKSAREIK